MRGKTLLVALLVLLVPVFAEAGGVATERRLSRPGPFAASEVSIAADPLDPQHLVASSNLNSGASFGVYVTRDGGDSWTMGFINTTHVDGVAGRSRFLAVSDPAVAFASDGTVYVAGLAYIPTSAVWVGVSKDGGATWTSRIVHESDLGVSFNDKPWLGVSPVTGTLVVAWQKEPALDQLRDVELTLGGAADLDVGSVVFARSTDGGDTWTLPQVASTSLHNNGTQVAFGADGLGHMLWVDYEGAQLVHAVSFDDGATWSAPAHVAPVSPAAPVKNFTRMHTLPALIVADGRAYAVWHDQRNGDTDVYAAASLDNGATWGPAVRVNDDPLRNGAHQMYPWAAVDAAGALHVGFYDSRQNATLSRLRFEYWEAVSPPGPLSFGPSRQVSTRAFNASDIGDYTGMAASSAGVFPVWADNRQGIGIWGARLT